MYDCIRIDPLTWDGRNYAEPWESETWARRPATSRSQAGWSWTVDADCASDGVTGALQHKESPYVLRCEPTKLDSYSESTHDSPELFSAQNTFHAYL